MNIQIEQISFLNNLFMYIVYNLLQYICDALCEMKNFSSIMRKALAKMGTKKRGHKRII